MAKKSKSQPERLKDSKDFDYIRDKYQPDFRLSPTDRDSTAKTLCNIGDLVTIAGTQISGTIVLTIGKTLGVLDKKGRIHYVKDFETYPFQE